MRMICENVSGFVWYKNYKAHFIGLRGNTPMSVGIFDSDGHHQQQF